MTHIKICGIQTVEDAICASGAGASMIGLVFYDKSLRVVSVSQAASIAKHPHVSAQTVGLFVNAEVGEVREVLAQVPLDLLQFHGDEDDAYCAQFGVPFIKAIRVQPALDLRAAVAAYPYAEAILLDAYVKEAFGGTGKTFAWDLIPKGLHPKLILAGGVNSDNVADAIQCVQPYAVDVSGGVEAEKGVKSQSLIQQFCAAAV
jgi:phosphoribosylanthranilate isomerase